MSHRYPSFDPPPGTTMADWGDLRVERRCYAPLETVCLEVGPGRTGATSYRVEWFDGLGVRYGWAEGGLRSGAARVEFVAGGAPGMQYARLWLDGREQPSRLVNYYLEAATRLLTGDPDLDALYPHSREAMRLNRRRYPLAEGQVVGYTTADSVQTLAYWLRDMYYNLPGYMLWEHDVASGYAALFARQHADGSLPDGVRADGSTWRMITESDVEYLAVLAVWRTWLITGDDAWMAAHLPVAERALEHLRGNPLRYDQERGLVRRAHTCDTWDFSIYGGDVYDENTPAVAALCDQTGYYQALLALAEMVEHQGDQDRAAALRDDAEELRLRAVAALWDGEKFQHHLHLDPFDHGSFDEGRQLAMSNTWAITRGLANSRQSQRIIATYRQRLEATGERFPWWSLQPGYPHDAYEFLRRHAYQHTGGYCNGGLMPWVGGALAQACFQSGEEPWGVDLLRDYAAFLRERDGEIYTWYWPNGEPGFRTANTTGHDGWGMGHWVAALFEGLAGVEITRPGMRAVTVSPRWSATDRENVTCVVHLPASEAYTAYRWRRHSDGLQIQITGVAAATTLRMLLPEGCRASAVTIDGQAAEWVDEPVGLSRYVRLGLEGVGVRTVAVALRPTVDRR